MEGVALHELLNTNLYKFLIGLHLTAVHKEILLHWGHVNIYFT